MSKKELKIAKKKGQKGAEMSKKEQKNRNEQKGAKAQGVENYLTKCLPKKGISRSA